jgi:hypothetical protein
VTRLGTGPVEDPDQLALVADPWTPTRQQLASVFKRACRTVANGADGYVNPNHVRRLVRAYFGPDTEINVRQYSALWSVATARDGYLDNTDNWVQISGPGSLGNGGKSVRLRRWRGWADPEPDPEPDDWGGDAPEWTLNRP